MRHAGMILLAALLAADAPAQLLVGGFTQTTVISGLTLPTGVAFLPDGRMLLAEGDGTLSLVDGGVATVLIVIPVAFCPDFDSETGLLGIAVDPDMGSNGFIYLYRTEGSACSPSDNEIVRVTLESDDTVDLVSLEVLLDGIGAATPYHNGGGLRVGPDGKLYAGTGDNYIGDDDTSGPGTSTNPFSQDLSSLLGKVLRLELDGSVPADNPFVGQGGVREEIFAYGFRNPWRFGFDPETDALWVGDVGQDDVEELDLVEAGSNHSWPQCEGHLPKKCAGADEAAPAFTYPHGGGKSLGSAVMGGAFAPAGFGYSGGLYFFADLTSSMIWRATPDAERDGFKGKVVAFAEDAAGPVDLVFGPDGALYYCAVEAGELRRIAPPESGGGQPLAGKSLALIDGPKKSLSLSASDAVVLGGADDNPLLAGGSLLLTSDDGLFSSYDLPAENWSLIGKAPDKVKGFKYKDPQGLSGPIKLVIVKAGKSIVIKGKGEALTHDIGADDPGPVLVTLQLGTRSFCLEFGGLTTFKPDKSFTAKKADAPASCR